MLYSLNLYAFKNIKWKKFVIILLYNDYGDRFLFRENTYTSIELLN